MKRLITLSLIFFVYEAASAQTAYAEPARGAFLGVRMDVAPSGRVRLTAVLPDSPAARAGFQSGDLILRFRGQVPSGPRDVATAVRAAGIGDQVPVIIERSGQRHNLAVTIGQAPLPGQLHRSFVGRPAPNWRLPRVDGSGEVHLSGLRGQVVLVYFWSVWCGACRMATPAMIRLERSLGNQGLEIFGVSDDPIAALRNSREASQLGFPLLHDLGSKVAADYWISAIPTFFLIDQSGSVVSATEGWDPAQGQQMEAHIRRLLGQRVP